MCSAPRSAQRTSRNISRSSRVSLRRLMFVLHRHPILQLEDSRGKETANGTVAAGRYARFLARCSGCGSRAARRHRQGRASLRTAADHRLSLQLPRSHQRRHRRADHEPATGANGESVRAGRRDSVPVLFGVRDTQQPHALSLRRAALACPYHDQLGAGVGGQRLCHRTAQLLRRAVSARCRRSRLFPRRDVLPRRLVSGAIPYPDAGLVPDRDSRIRPDRRPGLRHAAADGRHLGTGRMAMAVHPGQHSLHSARLPDAVFARRQPRERRLADAG